MIKSTAAILMSVSLAWSLPASAHTEEYFDSHAAPHGGQMRMAGPYHLELVTKDKEIVVYVSDHGDNKIVTEGAVGKASIQVGKAKPKTAIKLEPAGDNVLKGTGDFTVTPETVFIVFVKLPEQEAQSARFSPLKPAKKPQGATKSSGAHHEQASHAGHSDHGKHGGEAKQGNSGGHNHHMHH
jgi:hypothetical protein